MTTIMKINRIRRYSVNLAMASLLGFVPVFAQTAVASVQTIDDARQRLTLSSPHTHSVVSLVYIPGSTHSVKAMTINHSASKVPTLDPNMYGLITRLQRQSGQTYVIDGRSFIQRKN